MTGQPELERETCLKRDKLREGEKRRKRKKKERKERRKEGRKERKKEEPLRICKNNKVCLGFKKILFGAKS